MYETINTNAVNVQSNVAQNDKPASKAQATDSASVMLNQLEARRIAWEDGVYRKSNQELYGILADCLQFVTPLTFVAENQNRKKVLAKFYKEHGYRLRDNTPLATQVVRAVFGDVDRRRISTYSLVVRKAQKDGVLPQNLAQWIEDNGGVQEIRMGHSKSYVSPAQKASIAENQLGSLPTLAVIKTEALSLKADANHMGDDCVLLATQQADGSFVVKALLRGGCVKAAYTALYSDNKDDMVKAAAEKAAANDANGVADAA